MIRKVTPPATPKAPRWRLCRKLDTLKRRVPKKLPFLAQVSEVNTSKGEETIKGNLDTNMAAVKKGSNLSTFAEAFTSKEALKNVDHIDGKSMRKAKADGLKSSKVLP